MEQNASIRNGLIDAFQKRNFKLLVDPIEQAISCFEQYGRAEPSFNRQAAYFGQCIFSSSIKNDPFVQSITNDDVLTNNIHTSLARSIRYTQYLFRRRNIWQVERRLHSFFQEAVYRPPTVIYWFRRATVNLINFPNSGQTGLVSFNEPFKCCREFSFQHNGLLYWRACVRSEAYAVLFARKGKSFFA